MAGSANARQPRTYDYDVHVLHATKYIDLPKSTKGTNAVVTNFHAFVLLVAIFSNNSSSSALLKMGSAWSYGSGSISIDGETMVAEFLKTSKFLGTGTRLVSLKRHGLCEGAVPFRHHLFSSNLFWTDRGLSVFQGSQ
jgi:hypothetical protein